MLLRFSTLAASFNPRARASATFEQLEKIYRCCGFNPRARASATVLVDVNAAAEVVSIRALARARLTGNYISPAYNPFQSARSRERDHHERSLADNDRCFNPRARASATHQEAAAGGIGDVSIRALARARRLLHKLLKLNVKIRWLREPSIKASQNSR